MIADETAGRGDSAEERDAGDGGQVERIRSEITAMIARGELVPGERLREARLARQLNIGRNVTREALRALEQAGIVRIVPNRGAEIRKLSMEDALDLYDLRSGLARAAARLAARRVDRDQLEELADLQRQLSFAIDRDDAPLYTTVNRRFHAVIFEAARNPRLSDYNDALEEELKLFLTRTSYSAAAFRKSWEEHQRVLDALLAGEDMAAADAFEAHVIQGKTRLVEGEVSVRF